MTRVIRIPWLPCDGAALYGVWMWKIAGGEQSGTQSPALGRCCCHTAVGPANAGREGGPVACHAPHPSGHWWHARQRASTPSEHHNRFWPTRTARRYIARRDLSCAQDSRHAADLPHVNEFRSAVLTVSIIFFSFNLFMLWHRELVVRLEDVEETQHLRQ
jgi:hypothetical protein